MLTVHIRASTICGTLVPCVLLSFISFCVFAHFMCFLFCLSLPLCDHAEENGLREKEKEEEGRVTMHQHVLKSPPPAYYKQTPGTRQNAELTERE